MKYLFIFVIVLAVNRTNVSSIERKSSTTFVRTKSEMSGPKRLSPGWLDESIISCAVHCHRRFSTKCRCFMFNNETKLCTPANDLASHCPPPTVTEGDLYLCDSCQLYPKFSDFVNGSMRVSYYYETTFSTYADATAACDKLNSYLFVPDTLEKFRFFSNIIDTRFSTWIGLDDRNVEGKFTWANSGLEIDPVFKKKMFERGQPDNNKNEDCVQYKARVAAFNDENCSKVHRYVCERRDC